MAFGHLLGGVLAILLGLATPEVHATMLSPASLPLLWPPVVAIVMLRPRGYRHVEWMAIVSATLIVGREYYLTLSMEHAYYRGNAVFLLVAVYLVAMAPTLRSQMGGLLAMVVTTIVAVSAGLSSTLETRVHFAVSALSVGGLLWIVDRFRVQMFTSAYVLSELSRTDPLTGLFNRRGLFEQGPRIVQRAVYDDAPFALIYVDIDHFKAVNDRRGHDAGDSLLRTVARTIRMGLRPGDLVARVGGDEFVALLPGARDAAARAAAERIRAGIGLASNGETSASIGVCVREGEESLEELLRRTDSALYQAKAEGRDRVVFCSADGSPDATSGANTKLNPQD